MGKIYNVVFTIPEAAKNEDGDNIYSDKITFTSTVSEWTTTTAVDITQP